MAASTSSIGRCSLMGRVELDPRIGTVTNKQTDLSLIREKTEWEVGSDRERGLKRVFALVSVFRAHGWNEKKNRWKVEPCKFEGSEMISGMVGGAARVVIARAPAALRDPGSNPSGRSISLQFNATRATCMEFSL